MDKMLNQDMTESKLTILYILQNSKMPLKNTEITQIIRENNFMNYFILQQCLTELIEKNYIIVTENENYGTCYTISKIGKEAIGYFYNRIPFSIREKIVEILTSKEAEFKQDRSVICNYYPEKGDNFLVQCKILENNSTLLELKLLVGNKKQAIQTCNIWKEDPESIYTNIISIFNKKQKK